MSFLKNILPLTIASAASLASLQGQTQRSWSGATGTNWSVAESWGGDVPDTNAEIAFINTGGLAINVDGNFTVNELRDGGGGGGATIGIGGPGTITIDRNLATASAGITNFTNTTAGIFSLNGRITISNSLGGTTNIQTSNTAGNTIRFNTASILTINSTLQVIQGIGGPVLFNGTLAASTADLQLNSNNVSFGTGHVSSSFARDVVFFANSKLTITAGTVLSSGRKFQINGNNATLQLDGANTINGANINVGGTNNFRIDVNADQTTVGALTDVGAVTTINLGESVTSLWFSNSSSSSDAWGSGTVTINGFRENTVRFGTNANGLTSAQLAAINSGAYTLNNSGYLTTGAASSAIESWRQTYFGNSANEGNAADTADFDGDGLSNLLEYATGTNPTVANASAAVVAQSGNVLTVTFNRINDPLLTYTIEESTDLATGFTPTGTTYTGTANDVVVYTDDVPLTTGGARQFLRLRVNYGAQP
jgi:hypothetical protein